MFLAFLSMGRCRGEAVNKERRMVYEDPRTGKTLGGALWEWRTKSELTLNAVAEAVGSTITHIMDIENNKIGPSAQLLIKLASLYGKECVGCHSEAGWAAVIGWINVFSSLESPTNREMLDVVGVSIRRMRHLPEDGLVIMRDQEADIVCSMLNLESDTLTMDLRESFGLDETMAQAFVDRAVNRRDRRQISKSPISERIAGTYRAIPEEEAA